MSRTTKQARIEELTDGLRTIQDYLELGEAMWVLSGRHHHALALCNRLIGESVLSGEGETIDSLYAEPEAAPS